MSKQIKGLLYFFITDIRFSLTVFWIVLLSALFVSMLIDYFLIQNVAEGGFMTFGLSIALYVYCGILGFFTVKQAIPFSIKMGATRKNIFTSLGIFFLGLSLFKSLFANSLQSSIELLHSKTGNETFMFIHLANLINDTWFTRVLIDTSLMFFLLAFFYLIGLTFYKYGLIGGGSFVGIIVIVILSGFAEGWFIDFLIHVYQTLSTLFFWQIIFVAFMIYSVTWFLIRKITIIEVR